MSNRPELRFEEFSGEWKKVLLKDITSKGMYKNRNNVISEVFTNSAIEGIVTQRDYFDKDIANQNNLTNYYVVNKDDFVYNPRISKYAPVGPLHRNHLGTGVMSPLYTIFKVENKKIDLNFIEKYFHTKKWHHYMYTVANYGARSDRMNITTSDLFNMPIRVPKKQEQEKIASFLTSVDKKIEQLSRKIEFQEKYKKGLMQKIFSQEIRFRDDNGQNFSKWKEKKIKDVLVEHKARNIKNEISEVLSVAKTKGVINQIEHLGRSYAASDLTNYKVVFPNDIVYTKSPTSDFPFGIIKQNQLNRTGVVSTLYAVFKPSNRYIGSYLDYYFSSWVNTYNYLNPLVHKGAKNTMNINNSDFLNGAKIPMPTSEQEQEKIIEFLDSIDKQINFTKKQFEKTKEFKKGLLQRMFV